MKLQELSQILAAVGVSASKEEYILETIKKKSISLEVNIHERFVQEDWEVCLYHLCQSIKEIEESWIRFDEDPLKVEIEEFLTCLSLDPTCT